MGQEVVRGTNELGAGLQRTVGAGARALGADGVADFMAKSAGEREAAAAAPIAGETTWDTLKRNLTLGNAASFAAEQGVGSLPALLLAGSGVGLPAFAASRLGEVAQQRARNDGQQEAGLPDLAAAAPTAAVDTALQRFGLGGILGKEGAGIVRNVVTAAGRDALAQGGQGVVDYAGSTVGTDAPFDWRAARDAGLQGAVAGATLGAGGHLVAHPLARGRVSREVASDPLVDAPLDPATAASPQLALPAPAGKAALSAPAARLALPTPDTRYVGPDPRVVIHGEPPDSPAAAAASNPIVASILDSNLPPEAKIATVWDQVTKMLNTPQGNGPAPARADPYTAPTPDQATAPYAQSYMDRIRVRESGGNDAARATTSSASGRYQFTNATWLAQFKELYPDSGKSDAEILAQKGNGTLQDTLMRNLTAGNAKALEGAGFDASMGNLRLAHFLGRTGALRALRADPNTPIINLVGADAVRANERALGGRTAGEVVAAARAQMGDRGQPQQAPSRMAAPPADQIDGLYSGQSRPIGDDPAIAMADTENLDTRTSPATAEREAGSDQEAPLQSGGSDRLFRAVSDDPQGRPGFWEDRARQMGAEAQAKAQADLEAEWTRRAQERADAAASGGFARQAASGARQASGDPSGLYRGRYDQRPTRAGDVWATTPEGFVAGKEGNPVAFRSPRDAAQWAAKNAMGGDFELHSWQANSSRIVLKRRDGSTYGAPPEPPRPRPLPGEPQANAPQRMIAEPAREEPVVRPADARQDTAPAAAAIAQRDGAGNDPAAYTPPPQQQPAPHRVQQQQQQARGPRMPEDVLSFIARKGGLRDDEGHNLRKGGREMGQFAPRGGHVFRKNGMSIDDAGEALHEAGWFPGQDDWTTADVLDLLHRAEFEPQYHPDEIAAAHDIRASAENDRWEQAARGEIASVAGDYDEPHPREEAVQHMLGLMGSGASAHEAYRAHHEMDYQAALDEMGRAPLEGTIDGAVTGGDRAGPGTLGGPEHAADRPGEAGARAPGLGEDGQQDAFGIRPGDERAALERRGDGRQRADVAQKPAGSDGGLFDSGAHDRTLFSKRRDERTAVVNPSRAAASIGEARRVAGEFVGQPIRNTASGVEATVSRATLAKMTSEKAMAKSPSAAHHMLAVANVDHLFRAADLIERNADQRGEPTIAAISRWRAHLATPAGRVPVKLTVKETTHPNSPNPLYTIETAEVDRGDAEGGARIGAIHPQGDQASAPGRNRNAAPPGSNGDVAAGSPVAKAAAARGLGRDRPSSRPLADDLRALAAGRENTHARRLAARLADLVGDAGVRHGEDLGPDVRGAAHLDEQGRLSASVAHAGDDEALLHEAIHVATLSRYGELGPHAPEVEALEKLRARAAKAFTRRSDDPSGQIGHALTSADEFLAGGLTSPRVQQFLQRHNAAGLWGRFVDSVRGMLGVEPRYGSLLDRVLQHGARLIDQMEPSPVPVDRSGTTLLSRGRDDQGAPAKGGWGAIGDLIFDPEFRSGDAAATMVAIKRAAGDPKAAVATARDRLRQFGEAALYSTDGAMRSIARRFDAPTLTKLADTFHAEAGVTDHATGRTFNEAVTRNQGRFISRLDKALEDHRDDDAAMGRIRDLLATPDKPVRATAKEREAAGAVRDLLADVLDYRRDAGEAIGEVKTGYFPRQLRQDRVFADPDGFLKAAEAAYREIGADDPRTAAAAYRQNLIDGHLGIADGVGAGSPGASTAKAREFGQAADEHLRPYYDTNPLSALSSYLHGSVRRAEEARRFGAKGREGSSERAAWVKEHGARTQWDVMKAQIQDELRAKGQREQSLFDKIDSLRINSLGKSRTGSPRVGASVSVIHAWNQLSTLARATAASVPELSMGFVRAGPRLGVTHLATTMGEFVRNVRRQPLSDAARYAEAAGAIGSENALHLLRARAGDGTTNVTTGKLLDQFYKKNGLEAWTRAGRTAAVKTAQRFMDVLAGDMASSTARTRARAAGYLRELGVSDPEVFAANLRQDTPTLSDIAGDSGHAAEYATALLRFADQTVLMPTRSVKPAWASHPLGSLVFALQSYNYAFKRNVLDRVGRETMGAMKEHDPAKLSAAAGLVALVGTTAVVQGLRHLIWGAPVDNDKDTPLHYALETFDRAGLFGAASPIFNAFDGLKYQRSVGQSLQGSVFGRLSDAADIAKPLIAHKDGSNSAERAAAGAFYDMVINPAESAIGAGVLRGALGSAAIVAHGVRNRNGLLPADRAAFVDRVAGPKLEPVE